MKATLLGLDIGTTSTKAILFDLTGRELARAESAPYALHTPRPGWAEQDPEELWEAVLAAVRGAMEQAGGTTNPLALGMAAQSGSLLPAAADGTPVYPLITWMDARTEALVEMWQQEEGLEEQVKRISGWSLHPGLGLPTIAWLRAHDRATFSKARRFFSVNDFIAYRLTGAVGTNPSNGGGMQLVDIRTGQWSETLCAMAGITPEQLSPIRPSGTVIGEITTQVCRETGLPAGTVLVNGGHDQGCTAVALGVDAPGKLLLACGTAWVLTGVVDSSSLEGVPDPLDINYHPAPNRWTISQSLGGLGVSIEWWRTQAWPGGLSPEARQELYRQLNQALVRTEPGGGGLFFLPLTGGHDGPATARTGGFIGLQLSHTREDMARAILESAAFELRWALEAVEEAGLPVTRLWMVGGAARSPHWPAILTHGTGVPIRLPQYDHWPALGGAVLAGVGVKVFDSIEHGLQHFQKPVEDLVPDPALMSLYDELFDRYRQLRSSGPQHLVSGKEIQ